MKERPIIFSDLSVRAILDGRKTQTRRVIKNAPEILDRPEIMPALVESYKAAWLKISPFQPGDRLWVRETWADNVPGCPSGISYRADHQDGRGDGPASPMKWRSPIFMPRLASRITLEVLSVRVERLQEIDKKDEFGQHVDGGAWAEGFRCPNPTAAFMLYWDSLNAKRGFGWDANPWVWVIEFRRVDQEGKK